MKKILSVFIILLTIITVPVYATSGALRKASIKQCPDGKYYGNHSENKVIHWHLAKSHPEMSSGWSAVGDPLPGDPCPDVNHEPTTTTTTSTTKKTTAAAPIVITNNEPTTTTTELVVTESTTTTESTTKKSNLSNPKIVLKANDSEIKFTDHKGDVNLLYWENDISFAINSNYVLKVYDGDELKDTHIKYDGHKTYKIEIYLDNELIETNNIEITKINLIGSILTVGLIIICFLGVPAGIVFVIIKLVKKKKV